MEYRRLGNTSVKISEISVGGNTFGWKIDDKATAAVIDSAIALGVNYIDTADMYDQGVSEEYVGKAIKGKRYDLIIASKFCRPMGTAINNRGGSRFYIMRSIEASLKRLQTDYIDLYQMHEPDPQTPIEETLRALDDLVRSGKVRYIGTSNYAAWQACEAFYVAKMNNLHHFITDQSRYCILDRTLEKELIPFCLTHNIGFIPWGALAGGFLTGKYRKGEKPPEEYRLSVDTRETRMYGPLFTDRNWDILARLEKFGKDRGHSVGDVAIAWLLAKPYVSTVILGARSPAQMAANVAAGKLKLTPQEVAELDAISAGG